MISEETGQQIVNYLALIASDLAELRSDFNEFRGHGVNNLDSVTGPLGYSITDLAVKLDEISAALLLIDMNTSS